MENVEYREAISEVLEILKHTEKNLVNKISPQFMKFLNNNQLENYVSELNHTKTLNEMNLKEKTKDILAVIYLKYWCSSEEKKIYRDLWKKIK